MIGIDKTTCRREVFLYEFFNSKSKRAGFIDILERRVEGFGCCSSNFSLIKRLLELQIYFDVALCMCTLYIFELLVSTTDRLRSCLAQFGAPSVCTLVPFIWCLNQKGTKAIDYSIQLCKDPFISLSSHRTVSKID